jgi:class 3 adenylate cyclase
MTSLRRSVFLKLALSFLIFYSAYSAIFFLYDCFANMEEYKKARTVQVLNHLRLGQGMLKTGHLQELEIRLKDSAIDGYIDYYRVENAGRELAVRGQESLRKRIAELPADELVSDENSLYGKIVVGESSLIVGNNFGTKDRILRMWQESRKNVLQDVAFVLVCLALMTLYYFKDLIQVFRSIRRNDRAGIQDIRTDSVESEILVRAFGGYESHLKETQEKNKILSEQLLPALRKELDSGRSAPYEFECSMVRTDINGFSTIFNSHPREPFMATIGEFFWEATHIISRYGGLVHEFAGDEIIYYFKGEDSSKMAVSCVRDVNALASKFHEKTIKERGYGFIVKSAIAPGTLRFGKLVNNYTLAGAPFIETVRILTAVQEKEKNFLLFGAAVSESLNGLCSVKSEGSAVLKGYKGEMQLYSYVEHIDFSLALEKARNGDASWLQYFRSDENIIGIFSCLSQGAWNLESFLGVLSVLRSYVCTNASEQVGEEYSKLLARELEGDSHYRVASVVALSTQLLAHSHINRSLEELFLSGLQRNDRRVTANIIEVFSWFFPNRQVPELRRFLKDVDNRISANALVKAALERFDDQVIRKIQERVQSGSVAHLASALYAIGEIAAYYKTNDPIYLSTKLRFLRLLDSLPNFVKHSNPMVRRQAIMAAKKFDEEKLNKNLRAIFDQSNDKDLEELFQKIYGWHRQSVAKAG